MSVGRPRLRNSTTLRFSINAAFVADPISLDMLVLHLISISRAVNFKYIAIEWEKPKSYGDAGITGYKVYVNGVVEAALGPEQFTFSYTAGKWCREYAFQVMD